MAHEIEAAAHGRRIVRCSRATSSRPPPTRTGSRSRRYSCSTASARSSTSTASARATCRLAASARAAARTSRSCSNETAARSCSVVRRVRRCRRPRTTSCARRRLQLALREAGFDRLPTIVAVCDDESLLGVPFYVMELPGRRSYRRTRPPPGLEDESARRALGARSRRLARGDPRGGRDDARRSQPSRGPGATTSARFAASHSSGRSTRRVRSRASRRSAGGSPRTCPSRCRRPSSTATTGSATRWSATTTRRRILAVLDWEMGAIGDPRADVGYLLATYSEPGGPPNPLGTSPITALAGFPSRAELVERYVAGSGRDVEPLAVVRGARALEGGRLLRGDLRALRARRARRRGRARRAFRAGRALSRGVGCGRDLEATAEASSRATARSRPAPGVPRAAASRRAARSLPTRATLRAARRGAPSARRARPRR